MRCRKEKQKKSPNFTHEKTQKKNGAVFFNRKDLDGAMG